MAKKSDAVREMLASHPDMTAGEIAEALARKGITVSTQLVYNLRTKPGRKRRKSGAEKDLAAGIATINEVRMPPRKDDGVVGTIKRVKALAADVGGLPKLRLLVEALS